MFVALAWERNFSFLGWIFQRMRFDSVTEQLRRLCRTRECGIESRYFPRYSMRFYEGLMLILTSRTNAGGAKIA